MGCAVGMLGGEGGVRCHHGNRASALAAAQPHHCSCCATASLLRTAHTITRARDCDDKMSARPPTSPWTTSASSCTRSSPYCRRVSGRRPPTRTRLRALVSPSSNAGSRGLSLSLLVASMCAALVLGFKCSLLSPTV